MINQIIELRMLEILFSHSKEQSSSSGLALNLCGGKFCEPTMLRGTSDNGKFSLHAIRGAYTQSKNRLKLYEAPFWGYLI